MGLKSTTKSNITFAIQVLILLLLGVGAGHALYGAEADIKGLDTVRPGQFVTYDTTASVVGEGGTSFWIFDPELPEDWQSTECDGVLSTAFETAGAKYHLHFVCVDSEGHDVATILITVAGKAPTPPPVDPDPDVPPPSPGKVGAVSRKGAEALNDPPTQQNLKVALERITAGSTLDATKKSVRDAIDLVFLMRQGESKSKDWQGTWRVPVNQAITEAAPTTTSAYVALIQEVASSLVATMSVAPRAPPSPPRLTVYTLPSCGPCKQWKRTEAPKLVGWEITYITARTGSVPRFVYNGKTYQGYMSASTLQSL